MRIDKKPSHVRVMTGSAGLKISSVLVSYPRQAATSCAEVFFCDDCS
jgi:hypothetical protein